MKRNVPIRSLYFFMRARAVRVYMYVARVRVIFSIGLIDFFD